MGEGPTNGTAGGSFQHSWRPQQRLRPAYLDAQSRFRLSGQLRRLPLPTVVLSYEFWRRRFGGDPPIFGRPLPGLPAQNALIPVGVAAPHFELLFPADANLDSVRGLLSGTVSKRMAYKPDDMRRPRRTK